VKLNCQTNYLCNPVGGHLCWDWSSIFNQAVSTLTLNHRSHEEGFARAAIGGNSVHWFVKFYGYKKTADKSYRVNIDDGFLVPRVMGFTGQFPDDYRGDDYEERPLPSGVGGNTGRGEPLNPIISNQW